MAENGVGDSLELLTVGRISVDLYGAEAGVGFDRVAQFTKALGGSPTNVAVAAARLGRHAAVLTKVGADPFGSYLRRQLDDFGVDTHFVGIHPTLRTPLAFAVLEPPDDPPLLFYREPTAPDLTIEAGDVDPRTVASVPVLWVTGTGMSAEPSASATLALLATRGRATHTVVDLDYRPTLWADPATAGEVIGSLVDLATIVVGNRVECAAVLGTHDPHLAADVILERGASLAVVKMGADGVLAATPTDRAVVAPRPVRVRCGLGAGDAFGGALVHGLLSGWGPLRAVEFANAAGAVVASRLLCADDMPTEEEIFEVMDGAGATA